MSQCEETEEGVHPSETPLCGQHGSQTEAQRVPRESIGSPSSSVSIKSDRSKADIIDFKEGRSSLKSDFVLSSSEDEEGLQHISSSEDEEGLQHISSSEDEEDVAADDGDLPEQRRPDSPVLRMPVESSWSTHSSSASQSIDSYPKVALKRKASTGSSSLSVDSSQGCINAKEKPSSPKKRKRDKMTVGEFVVGGSAATETSSRFLRAKLGAASVTVLQIADGENGVA